MKLLNNLIIVLILVGLAPQAWADLRLATPKNLLQKASVSRVACREVILDISQNIPELRDPATFDKYFSILPELSALAQKHRLDEIYPDAVKSLGLRMVTSGVRWLSIVSDSPEKILFYHSWMNSDVAYVFQNNSDLQARESKDPVVQKLIAEKIDQLIGYTGQMFPQNPELKNGYRRILSDLAARKLREEDLADQDRTYWIGKLSTTAGYNVAIDSIHSSTLALTKENKEKSQALANRLLVLASRIKLDANNQPQWIFSQIADVSLELILKNIDLQVPFQNEVFKQLLNLLSPRHLQGLSQQWTDISRIPDSEYVEHYLSLTRSLIQALRANNLEREANEVKKFEERLAAPIVGKIKRIEGTYSLTDPNGKKWKFTAILARQALIYVELADEAGFVNTAYFNITYGVEDDTFVGSEREVDLDPSHNFTIRFRLLGNGEIEVRNLMAPAETQYLKGKKVESYPDYFPESTPTGEDPSGTYKGKIYFGKEFEKEVTLIVTGFNGYSLGRAVTSDGFVTLDLNMGTRGTDRILYLTTGRVRGSHWIHLRGILKDGEYRGFTIVGGRGISTKEFVLKKISN